MLPRYPIMMLLLTAAAAAAAAAAPTREAARPQWLDPTYHFRRAANHMNDPNVRCSVSLLLQRVGGSEESQLGLHFFAADPFGCRG